MIKRAFDIVASLAALVLLGIPMLLIAAVVRLESSGAAIFRQKRAGWRGKPFTMLKFRSMKADVEVYGSSPHSPDDPRLTKIGKFLRETSLDELPQLFNVLGGTMSLVGPRPLYERQAELWDENQGRRLDVRPGITGYAQAFGRGDLPIEDKIEMDLFYVDNRSLRLDFKIIVKTILNLFTRHDDVYEKRYSRMREFEKHREKN